jgi:hypothetical protein
MRIDSEFSEYILEERRAGSFNHYVGAESAGRQDEQPAKVARNIRTEKRWVYLSTCRVSLDHVSSIPCMPTIPLTRSCIAATLSSDNNIKGYPS